MDLRAELVRAVGQVVAGLCLVGVAVWASARAFSADPAVGGAIVAALAGVVGVVFERSRVERERQREVQRERMEPMYKEFVERARQAFASGQSSPEAKEFFTKFAGNELLLGADARVIRAFLVFKKTKPTSMQPHAPQLAYDALLRSIRCDLGHRDLWLRQGDLLRLFTDYQ